SKPAGPGVVPQAAAVVSASSRSAADQQPPQPSRPERPAPPPAGTPPQQPTELASTTRQGPNRVVPPRAGKDRLPAGPDTPGGEPSTATPPAREAGTRPAPPIDRSLVAMNRP